MFIGAMPIAAQEAIRVGGFEVWVLQENASAGDPIILIDASAEVLAQYAPQGSFPMATNAVLIRKGGRVWIIDTGFGRNIFDKMATLGISPEDVDAESPKAWSSALIVPPTAHRLLWQLFST